MSWPIAAIVFGSMAALIVASFLQWSGRWRSWYRPDEPGLSLLFDTLGASPLLVPTLLGGLLVMVGLVLVSSIVRIHALIDVGIAAGLAGLLVGGWIAFRQPEWALPSWIREQRASEPGQGQSS